MRSLAHHMSWDYGQPKKLPESQKLTWAFPFSSPSWNVNFIQKRVLRWGDKGVTLRRYLQDCGGRVEG